LAGLEEEVSKKKPNVLLCGGKKRKNQHLIKKIERFGVKVTDEWEGYSITRRKKIPKRVDLVLALIPVMGHMEFYHSRDLAKKAGKPYLTIGKNMPEIAAALSSYFGYPDGPKMPPLKAPAVKARGKGSKAKSQLQRQHQKMSMAAAGRPMPFGRWVKQVSQIRGRSLTQGNPFASLQRALKQRTWYDVWFEGASPQEAARMGSRSLI
jgi:hypothetical protein